MEKYRTENEKISKDIPGLQEVLKDTWKREDELKALKNELTALEHRIEASLKSGTPGHDTGKITQNDAAITGLAGADMAGKDSVTGTDIHGRDEAVPMPDNLENPKKSWMTDRSLLRQIRTTTWIIISVPIRQFVKTGDSDCKYN